MHRTLIHYRGLHLAVLAGAAVATAVLSGALLVGDSVRGSLRDLVLDRLGEIDSALVAPRFFREELATEWKAAPAILLPGAAVASESRARASKVAIHGVDARFTELFGAADGLDFDREAGQLYPSVIVNAALRDELEVEVGDAVLLHFARQSDLPRDTLMGESDPEDVLGTLRLTVTAVLADEGLGRFGLTPNQFEPFNAFVALPRLQRALDLRNKINALFLGSDGRSLVDTATFAERLPLADRGIELREAADHLVLESDAFVLRPDVDDAVARAAEELGAPFMRVQSYLANEMRVGERRIPYSLLAALDPLAGQDWASLKGDDGAPAPRLAEGEILLGRWAADDLGAAPGDEVELTYYEVGPREELLTRVTRLRVAGVVAMSGLAVDAGLTPEYPGIQEAEDISGWDPPFPVDLGAVRPADENYWDEYGAAPKAFVSTESGRLLWSTRFGSTTSIRIGAVPGMNLTETAAALRGRLAEKLPPSAFGMEWKQVRAEGLRASAGATDFSGLFVAFSFFLILAAAMLVGLLFRLGVERRAGEIGLRLAVGFEVAAIRRRLLAEGALLASAGAVVGVAGGVAYAWLLMAALRSVWLPAVGSSRLFLHVEPRSLIIGAICAIAVVVVSVAATLSRLRRIPPPTLLAGSVGATVKRGSAARSRWIAAVTGLSALGLISYAAASGRQESPGLAFGAGALLLIAGLAAFAAWCRRERRRGLRGVALVGMAARNSAWNPGRSILSVALVACAVFVIVTVAASHREFGDELLERTSGAGGFPLIAESDVPIYQNLNRAEDRAELGFSGEQETALGSAELYPFRVLPGEDASCLNLYQPEKPRVLGVPAELIDRGGFSFSRTAELPPDARGPWDLLLERPEPGVVPAFGDANSVQWILHLGLGDELEMLDDLGQPLRLRLVGLLDTSVFQSELLIAEEAFHRHFPGRGGYGYFLVDTPADQAEATARALEGGLSAFGFDATSSREKLAAYKVVEHTYLSTFQMLGALGLLLGTIGLSVVLVRNVIERRGELATLRAVGFRRSTLAGLVLAENGFLLIVGIGIGSFSALAASAPRLATIPAPWGSIALTLLVVLSVGMLASIAAVSGALRTPLLPALKAER